MSSDHTYIIIERDPQDRRVHLRKNLSVQYPTYIEAEYALNNSLLIDSFCEESALDVYLHSDPLPDSEVIISPQNAINTPR